jgi:hypothetical protein
MTIFCQMVLYSLMDDRFLEMNPFTWRNKIATFVCSECNSLYYYNPSFVSVASAAARRRALVFLSPPYQRHPLTFYAEISHGVIFFSIGLAVIYVAVLFQIDALSSHDINNMSSARYYTVQNG